jgi:aspartate carbamoyltransferase catalytic subunit
VPVVNGGDGANQHPTQTLLDLFSIYETQGTLDNLNVAFVGDLKYGRTVHSLTQALSKFNNVRFFFIAPEVLAMPDYICEELEDMGIQYSTHSSIEEVVPELDVLYMTRVQKERFDASEYAHMKSAYILTADTLKDARQNMKVLHPLSRVDEITTDVDKTPHAYYFEQAENGVYAREALLALVLNDTL